MPGPGSGIPEHEFRKREQGARVFAVVYRCIKDHTAIPDEQAQELARAVADAHTTAIHRRRR